jgi:predicted aldo/keto reductase-like oxidoreductase
MRTMTLGRTGIVTTQTGFGCLPVQRRTVEEGVALLRAAYEGGIRFYDTARAYSDSEHKLGLALSDVRRDVVIATKTQSLEPDEIRRQLDTSLSELQTDYVDIYQLHNPKRIPHEDDPVYQTLLDLKRQGLIRFIGCTNHMPDLMEDAIRSGLYDVAQFPLSCLSTDRELAIIDLCREYDVGLLAMKSLAGGLINHARVAAAFHNQFANVLPIWGIQHQHELEEFLALDAQPPQLDEAIWAEIHALRTELAEDFCRGCGYCLPCPADIPIPMAARMPQLLRRAPSRAYLTPHWQEGMARIQDCRHCNACSSRCPYGHDVPGLLSKALADYRQFQIDHPEI